MRLVEVRLVQCGAAQACYQPITGQAWQSWGLAEEGGGGGGGGGWRKSHHYHCTCSVRLWRRGCGAVGSVERERGGAERGVGGRLTPFLFLRPRGITRCLYCIFCTTWLADFFFLNIFPPLAPSSRCASAGPCQAGKAKQLWQCRAVPH